MKFHDVIIIGLLALLPLALSQGLVFGGNLAIAKLPIVITLVVTLIYFAIKCFFLYVATYSKQTFFRTSVNVEIFDIITGGFWGIVIFRYYQLDYSFLMIWILIGLFIFIIGFLSGAAINENYGIRLKKSGRWMKWSEISEIYINPVFFGFQTKNGRLYPVLANKVNKTAFENLKKGVIKVAQNQGIKIHAIPTKGNLILGEAQFEEDGDALDDFIAKIKDFVLIEPKGLLFSEQNELIAWAKIFNIDKQEHSITIEYNPKNPKQKKLYQDDFNTKDWEKMMELF
ncbi:MAG: hypothetical protein AB8G11_22145 [Saprospiraceae bacterium]